MSFVETREAAQEWALDYVGRYASEVWAEGNDRYANASEEAKIAGLLNWVRGTGGGCGPSTPTHEYRGDELRVAQGGGVDTWDKLPYRFSFAKLATEAVRRLHEARGTVAVGGQGRLL